jgi:hypothetical protein
VALTPLKDLMQLKPRPETTLALETSIQAGVLTVQSYRFTSSLRDYFQEMLDLVVSRRGQGYSGYKQSTVLARHTCSARLECS